MKKSHKEECNSISSDPICDENDITNVRTTTVNNNYYGNVQRPNYHEPTLSPKPVTKTPMPQEQRIVCPSPVFNKQGMGQNKFVVRFKREADTHDEFSDAFPDRSAKPYDEMKFGSAEYSNKEVFKRF